MQAPVKYSSLSAPDQWWIRQLQQLGFGRISFIVQGGSAHPAAGYRVVRTVKLRAGGEDVRPMPQVLRADFILRNEQLVLLENLRVIPDGTRVTVKVAVGLPTNAFEVEQEHQAA
ncbi:MAG TPA: hypothetical protein VGN72_09465 [Tepidisphaeraceae bacterium]|jgi:hypothetical protein|nr:hypothetical protein [Tepidisphaeraceae bacterium]